jgi:TRAP-type C4-dicarboxylate transport system permease small subunit|tara:strand:- start:1323 stop:1847 length:525 start_codon:yes stop_codon:yes gene_type:complete
MLLKKIIDLNNKFIKFLKYTASSGLIVLGLLILFDVVMRTFVNKPVIGVAEIIANSIVMIAFSQIAYTISIDSMVKSEYLLKKASYNLSCFLEIFSCILGIVFFGLIAYSSFEPTINSYIRNEFEGHASFRFPTFPVRLSIFAGSIFAAFTYFLRMLIFFSNIQTNNQKREVQE